MDIKTDDTAETRKEKRKVRRRNVLILILIVIIITLLLRSCSGGTQPVLEDAEYIEQEEGQGSISRGVKIPIPTDFSVSKDRPYIGLYNPEENKDHAYLEFIFTDKDTGNEIYRSKLVKPAQKFSVDVYSLLGVGEHNINIRIQPHNYEDPDELFSSSNTDIKVTVYSTMH